MRWRLAAAGLAGLLTAVAVTGQSRSGWFDLPVQGGAATLASLGVPDIERALTLPLLARALHDRETRFANSPKLLTSIVRSTSTPAVGADTNRESIDIPAPLDADTWRQLLDLPGDADLFARFLTDREALLLSAALVATDDSIRQLVAQDRDLLRFLYRDGAAAFLIVSRSLAIENSQVVVPGGTDGAAIWEALSGTSPSRAAPFIRALVGRDHGRLAWYFDTIARLDAERLAAAWPVRPNGRIAAARGLYEVFRDADPQWRASLQPFRRTVGDPWSVLTITDVAEGGALRGPAAASFWRLVFESDRVELKDAQRSIARDASPISLPAMTRAVVLLPPRERRQRFEMLRMAQRVFSTATANDLPIVAVAINGYKRFPSLLLGLERMGIANPATWTAMVAAAHHVSHDADDQDEALAAFQAVVGIVGRLRHVRVLDVDDADRLLTQLSSAVLRNQKVIASIASWILDVLLPALPALEQPDAFTGATAYESRLLQALAGRRDRAKRTLNWEGLTYAVDLVAAEHARLRAVRLQIPSPGLDNAIVSRKPHDLAAALTALIYTVSLGPADGAISLSRDVATRHDFGQNATALLQRMTPWAPPEEQQSDGPWHVAGSLIGLDAGLSRLTLRRLTDAQLPQAPTLTLNDFATLTRTIVALIPTELSDDDRDALAAAIQRGRQRVLDARGNLEALRALGHRVQMSAATRQTLPWMLQRDPESILGCFSLRDLLWLGEPVVAAGVLDRWGTAGQGYDGRPLTFMPPPAPWDDFAGRADAGQMTTQVPDVTLRLAEETARLRLPASLVPALLAYAVEDFWHDAQTRFADDWPRMVRQAAALDGSRVEDYVAALVGDGILRAQ
jgi:hypothetical protein